MSRALSIKQLGLDPSKLGPNSPLLALMRKAPRRDLEHQEQTKVFDWAREHESQYPDLEWLFAVPNWIGVRTAKQGARLKAEGRKPGVLDMWLPVKHSRYNYPGLVIELKVGNNVPTLEQQRWISHLHRQGWLVVVAYGADEAITALKEYFADRAA